MHITRRPSRIAGASPDLPSPRSRRLRCKTQLGDVGVGAELQKMASSRSFSTFCGDGGSRSVLPVAAHRMNGKNPDFPVFALATRMPASWKSRKWVGGSSNSGQSANTAAQARRVFPPWRDANALMDRCQRLARDIGHVSPPGDSERRSCGPEVSNAAAKAGVFVALYATGGCLECSRLELSQESLRQKLTAEPGGRPRARWGRDDERLHQVPNGVGASSAISPFAFSAAQNSLGIGVRNQRMI